MTNVNVGMSHLISLLFLWIAEFYCNKNKRNVDDGKRTFENHNIKFLIRK